MNCVPYLEYHYLVSEKSLIHVNREVFLCFVCTIAYTATQARNHNTNYGEAKNNRFFIIAVATLRLCILLTLTSVLRLRLQIILIINRRRISKCVFIGNFVCDKRLGARCGLSKLSEEITHEWKEQKRSRNCVCTHQCRTQSIRNMRTKTLGIRNWQGDNKGYSSFDGHSHPINHLFLFSFYSFMPKQLTVQNGCFYWRQREVISVVISSTGRQSSATFKWLQRTRKLVRERENFDR